MRKVLFVTALTCFLACSTSQPVRNEVITQIEAALVQQPERTPLIYYLASLYAEQKNHAAADRWLLRLEELGWTQGVDFSTSAVAKRLDARVPVVSNSTVAFTLPERQLMAEGITYDPVDDVFYVGSMQQRKVLRVERNGRVTDFVTTRLRPLGMKVDAERRVLWVGAMGADKGGDEGQAALYRIDLRDGSIRTQERGSATEPSLLNDIAILEDGSVLVTDSLRGTIVDGSLQTWAEGFGYTNGIARDGHDLYVADFRGLTKFDLRTKARTTLTPPPREHFAGIDGLTYHDGTLIGVQNTVGRPRIVRIHPADNRLEVLESRNPHFEIPTTGTMAGEDYYFIANAQLRTKPEAMKETVVLRLKVP
ncbi:MAG TPA: hypothetical protein VF618_16605 [Thermoanaerobaculia bacterium]